jgi:hypothetical protein
MTTTALIDLTRKKEISHEFVIVAKEQRAQQIAAHLTELDLKCTWLAPRCIC